MSNDKVPRLDADLSQLTDEQIISWYSRYPHVTVQSLVQRIAYNNEKHRQELVNAYAEGIRDEAKRAKTSPSPLHGLTHEELRLGGIHAHYDEY